MSAASVVRSGTRYRGRCLCNDRQSLLRRDFHLAQSVPSADGLTLLPYTGADASQLTVGGEMNKLAANIAIGRNHAGVHWRSDYEESLLLGEAIAISLLSDQRATYNETFSGFTFTRFDGTKITV